MLCCALKHWMLSTRCWGKDKSCCCCLLWVIARAHSITWLWLLNSPNEHKSTNLLPPFWFNWTVFCQIRKLNKFCAQIRVTAGRREIKLLSQLVMRWPTILQWGITLLYITKIILQFKSASSDTQFNKQIFYFVQSGFEVWMGLIQWIGFSKISCKIQFCLK